MRLPSPVCAPTDRRLLTCGHAHLSICSLVAVQIGQMYGSLFQSSFSGIVMVARVENTDAAVANWIAFETARYNTPATVIGRSPHSVPEMWLVQDTVPVAAPLHGINTARSAAYAGLESLLLATNASTVVPGAGPIDLFGRLVGFSGLFTLNANNDQLGLAMATPVWYDAAGPTHVVCAITTFDIFIESTLNISADAAIVITDQYGASLVAGGCHISDTDSILAEHVLLANSIYWEVQIGQCHQFTQKSVTAKKYGFVGVGCALTVLIIALGLLLVERLSTQKRVHEEKTAAHQLIVGYICHELRNPLHIVRTAHKVLVDWALLRDPALRPYLPKTTIRRPSEEDNDGVDSMSSQELAGVIKDATSALGVMQGTVNEVLDFRSIQNGINSLKLNPQVFAVAEVSVCFFDDNPMSA